MAKIEKNSFGYLGFDYQVRLMAQILTDSKFVKSIIDILDPNYFEDPYLRIISATIKDAKKEYDIIPDISSLRFRLLESVTEDVQRKYVLAQLEKIQEANLNDTLKIQDVATDFCKKQELRKAIKEINKIIDTSDSNEYEQCEAILKKALEHGDINDIAINVLDNISSVLEDDFRQPIPTGIDWLDDVMDGGLGKGELGLIIAALGVGKAQPLTSKILTPNGWVTMGDVKVGDEVLTPEGETAIISGVFPQGVKDIYEVILVDGRRTEACGEHLWKVYGVGNYWSIIDTNEIIKHLENGKQIMLPKLSNIGKRTENFDNIIKSIEYVGQKEAQCIMIDDENHLYITDDYIVTHNTTMATKIANTAMMEGYKVMQIFFEDNPKVIQRKHLSCWSKYPLNDLALHKEELAEMVNEMASKTKNGTGRLDLVKFSSDGTTIPMIRQYIRKRTAQGFKPDVVIIDYIDCVVPSKKYDDINAGEGSVMRQFEAMATELDVVAWSFSQGNRGSIRSEVLETDQMAGSLKKAMIAHFICSIAKSLDQRDDQTANAAILKSRFGKSGVVFENIIFDNARIQIEMGANNRGARTRVEHKQDVKNDSQNRVNSVLEAARLRKEMLEKGKNPDSENKNGLGSNDEPIN